MHACTHAHMHTCTHARMHACTHAHMHTCTHVRMYACTHVRMYACTHVRMYNRITWGPTPVRFSERKIVSLYDDLQVLYFFISLCIYKQKQNPVAYHNLKS